MHFANPQGTIIVSLTNCGYLEFTENWLARMAALGVDNYLLVAEDEVCIPLLHVFGRLYFNKSIVLLMQFSWDW